MIGLIELDLALSVLVAAGLLAAGSLSGRGRRWSLAAAVVLAAARVAVVLVLWRDGWWFVQEKVVLTLPLSVVTLAVAVWAVARWRGPAVSLALLVAGYAAAAAPIVTLLAGYPASWSLALFVLGLVGLAGVVTARVLGLARLRASAVGAGTLVMLGLGVGLVQPSTVDADSAPATSVTALTGPSTPAPGGSVRTFTLQARTADVTVDGRTVPAWTFNGQVPGPQLTAVQGDLLEVTLTNVDITAGVTLHWHGYDVPNAADGAPGLTQDAVLPGQSFVYRFRADQVGTYWYHTHEVSARGVKLGLYGTFVVTARDTVPAGVDLAVPMHTLDGTFTLGAGDQAVPAGTPVRLRLINTDDTPRLVQVVGTTLRVVAVDGSDLNQPGLIRDMSLLIPAGGRYDVAFEMAASGVSLRFPDHSSTVLSLGSPVPVDGVDRPVLDLLSYGAPAPQPFTVDSLFDRRFTLVLDRGLALVNGVPAYAYTVDGYAYPKVPTEVVAAGDLVEFTVVNRSFVVHPWHLHGHRVLVLSRDGEAPTGSPLWMDTFDVRPGEVWRVAFRADNPGVWMNHCHNLSHADEGMALHLRYEGVSSPFHGSHGG
jgi:FtsP/CotA-like multicopper oxidase with cupredoxin domain